MNYRNKFQATERQCLAVCGSLCVEKEFVLIFIPFDRFVQKSCLNKSIFSSGFASFKHGKKNKLSEYFSARFWDRLFWLKRKVLDDFLQNYFSTTERHSLAQCGSLCWEKQFLLLFIFFYRFVKKKLFKQIQIFLRICPFWNMVRKKNWQSISVLLSAIVTFMLKEKSSMNFPKKPSKQQKGIV